MYHQDEPANKFYSEQTLDNKGQQIYNLNSFAEKLSENIYIDGTGIIESEVDMFGNKISYGYDVYDDTLLQMTTSIDDEVNSNIVKYTGDLLTSLIHNNTEIKFEYNGFKEQTKCEINNQVYCTTEYEDIIETKVLEDNTTKEILVGRKTTTINALNEKFVVYSNIDGNITKIEFIDVNNNIKTLVEYRYDGYGNLIYSQDNENFSNTGINYDESGRLLTKTYNQNNVSIQINNVYDRFGNVSHTTISFGGIAEETFETEINTTYSNDTPDPILSEIRIGSLSEIYEYDKLGRIKKTDIGILSIDNRQALYNKYFNYLQKGDHTSNLISGEWFGINGVVNDNFKYSYDNKGNIVAIFENGILIKHFEYDAISRLIREDDKKLNKTVIYAYDTGGNIISKTNYNYSRKDTDELENGQIIKYTYPDSGWKDQLLNYNGQSIVYDSMGNPTTYRNNTLLWSHGRQLDAYNNITFGYNAEGFRTTKTVNNIATNFYLDGNRILAQNNGNLLVFNYGSEGVIGFTYKNVGEYYYKKNIFGDIISILKSNGEEIVKYYYDAWGNHKTYVLNNGQYVDISETTSYTQDGLNNKTIAQLNPFRYRGYYYDVETGLYYLNSRYYDPEIGRFINADDISILSKTLDEFNGLNLYAYCFNNPVNSLDEDGQLAWWKKLLIGLTFIVVGAIITAATAGAGTGFWAAFGSALLTSTIQTGISMGISAGIGAIAGGITSSMNGGSFWQGVTNGLIDGAIDGFMWGGIFSGGAQILSGGFRELKQYVHFSGISNSKFAFLSPDKLFYKTPGMTLIRIGNPRGLKFAIDLGRYGIHMHLFNNAHIPMIPIIVTVIEFIKNKKEQ